MAENKIATYLGFARRAGKLALGVNAAQACKRGVYLLVADSSASENTKKEIEKLAARFSCPVVFVTELENMVGKALCKLAAVREEQLARAIVVASSGAK